jgi:hypothetical protein
MWRQTLEDPLHQELGKVFWSNTMARKETNVQDKKEDYATLVDSRDILAKIVQTVTSLNPN